MDYHTLLFTDVIYDNHQPWIARFAALVDQVGLMQFRAVRRIFSIGDDTIEKVNRYFNKPSHQQTPTYQSLRKEWADVCKRWDVKILTGKSSPAQDLFRKQDWQAVKIDNDILIDPIQADKLTPRAFQKKSPSIDPVLIKFDKLLEKDFLKGFGLNSLDNTDSFRLRTLAMDRYLGQYPDYQQKERILKIDGKDHQVISADVVDFADNTLPLVSCGSSASRELILLDPSHSPLLQKCYHDYLRFLNLSRVKLGKDKLDAKELVFLTEAFMSNHVFPSNSHAEKEVDDFVDGYLQKPDCKKLDQQPCIPIDAFLQAKIGVCRHHSLVAAYLMDRFIQHHPEQCSFQGKVQIQRDQVIGGAHAWVSLICKDGSTFCMDSLNHIMGDLADPAFIRGIRLVFGTKAIDHQLKNAGIVRDRHLS